MFLSTASNQPSKIPQTSSTNSGTGNPQQTSNTSAISAPPGLTELKQQSPISTPIANSANAGIDGSLSIQLVNPANVAASLNTLSDSKGASIESTAADATSPGSASSSGSSQDGSVVDDDGKISSVTVNGVKLTPMKSIIQILAENPGLLEELELDFSPTHEA